MNRLLIEFKLSRRKGVAGWILNWLRKRVYVMVVDFLSDPLKNRFDKIQQELAQIKTKISDFPIDIPTFDWLDFDNRFRGPESLIKKRQKKYLKYFKGAKTVLDVGCGRGEFLELLGQNQIKAVGVDNNSTLVEYCQKKGLNVIEIDLFDYLTKTGESTFDGITAFQVIEHLTPNQLIFFLQQARRVLKPAGKILVETPNPTTIYPLTHSFYLDPTHTKPYPPLLTKFLLEKAGFGNIKIIFASPVKAGEKLNEGVKDSALLSNFKKLNTALYGSQDYAVIGEKI